MVKPDYCSCDCNPVYFAAEVSALYGLTSPVFSAKDSILCMVLRMKRSPANRFLALSIQIQRISVCQSPSLRRENPGKSRQLSKLLLPV